MESTPAWVGKVTVETHVNLVLQIKFESGLASVYWAEVLKYLLTAETQLNAGHAQSKVTHPSPHFKRICSSNKNQRKCLSFPQRRVLFRQRRCQMWWKLSSPQGSSNFLLSVLVYILLSSNPKGLLFPKVKYCTKKTIYELHTCFGSVRV